jgi:hypothetical protein
MDNPFRSFQMLKPVMCEHCGQYTVTPIWKYAEFGRGTLQYPFCDELHAAEYYAGKLSHDQRT